MHPISCFSTLHVIDIENIGKPRDEGNNNIIIITLCLTYHEDLFTLYWQHTQFPLVSCIIILLNFIILHTYMCTCVHVYSDRECLDWTRTTRQTGLPTSQAPPPPPPLLPRGPAQLNEPPETGRLPNGTLIIQLWVHHRRCYLGNQPQRDHVMVM